MAEVRLGLRRRNDLKPRDLLLVSVLVPFAAAAAPVFKADASKKCDACEAWNAPQEPFRVFGNTYYVGVAGLSAVLIASDRGLILLDGDLPQSAPLIDANIRKLGFRTEDLRLIVNSHAHFDHAGGIAALQRASGATVAASAWGARAIENGAPPADDPQYAFGAAATSFPAAKHVKVVADGETLAVGPLAITAHLTPGHTPGGTPGPGDPAKGRAASASFTPTASTPSRRRDSVSAAIGRTRASRPPFVAASPPSLASLATSCSRFIRASRGWRTSSGADVSTRATIRSSTPRPAGATRATPDGDSISASRKSRRRRRLRDKGTSSRWGLG